MIAAGTTVATVAGASLAVGALTGSRSPSSAPVTAAAAIAPGAASPTPIPTPRIHGAAVGSVSDLQGATFTVTRTFAATTHITHVATDSSTVFTRTQKGAVGDIKVGDRIFAAGSRAADGSLSAARIVIVPAAPINGGPGRHASSRHAQPSADGPAGGAMHLPIAFGTVQSISSGVITIAAKGGTGTDTISTASTTLVIETVPSSLGAISNGSNVAVFGVPTADDKTLTAQRVDIFDPALGDATGLGGVRGLGVFGGLGAGDMPGMRGWMGIFGRLWHGLAGGGSPAGKTSAL